MTYLMLYESTLDSSKVMGLSLEAKGFWMLCLLAASRNRAERGVLPRLEDLAHVAREKEENAERLIEVLIKRRLLDRREDGAIVVHDWEVYQPKTSKARTQRWRDRQANDPSHVTPVTSRDVTERHVTSRDKCDALEERRGDKKRGDEAPPSPPGLSRQEAIEDAMEIFGGGPASAFGRDAERIEKELDHMPQLWDAMVAAMKTTRRQIDNGRRVDNIVTWCQKIARDYLAEGNIPVSVDKKAVPKKSRDEEFRTCPIIRMTPEQRAEMRARA